MSAWPSWSRRIGAVAAATGAALATPAAASWDLRIEGLVDVGLARVPGGGRDWHGFDADDPTRRYQGPAYASRLRVVATETLPWSWKLEARLEQAWQASTGEMRTTDEKHARNGQGWFGMAHTVELGHYAYGRLRIGHQAELARGVVDAMHPWAGRTVASDACAALLHWPCPDLVDDEAARAVGQALGARGGGVRYDAPGYGPWQASVQAIEEPGRRQATVALTYLRGDTLLAVAHVRQSSQAQATPLVAAQSIGPVRLHMGLTEGRNAGAARRFKFLGVTGQLERAEWMLGVHSYTSAGTRLWTKVGLGLQRPLSHRLALYANVARWNPASGPAGRGADLGLRLVFN